jgi:histidyl-tRNA synthetase
MPDIIEPRVLKGFRDYLPDAEIERKALIDILERVFRSFGFVPIDTPVLEYAEILLGKGGGETDKQVYRFKDHGGRDVAMRFDLTVPFARFMAEHVDELYLPFRRYHMAKVWRGENTQRGRYREFMQCDFDIVGVDSGAADADIVLLIRDALASLEIGAFTVRVNHRGLFNRFLASLGAGDRSPAVLRAVDKLDKIGAAEVRKLLSAEIGEESAARVLEYIEPAPGFEEGLARLERLAGGPGPDSERLRFVFEALKAAGGPAAGAGGAGAQAGRLILDPSITRGLDYYTGVVFETRLDAMPEIGSVCGGGRYDELASLYTAKRLPGVGAAIGLDRLLAALEAQGKSRRRPGYTELLVLNLEDGLSLRYEEAAAAFRAAGLSCEVFPERKKLAQQYSYAEKKAVPLALVLGAAEAERGVLVVKDLGSRESLEAKSLEEAVRLARERLGR